MFGTGVEGDEPTFTREVEVISVDWHEGTMMVELPAEVGRIKAGKLKIDFAPIMAEVPA